MREKLAPPEFGANAIDYECVAVADGGCPYGRLAAGGETKLEERLTGWLADKPQTQQPATDLLETLTQQEEETEEEVGESDGDVDDNEEVDETNEAVEPERFDGSDMEDPNVGDNE